MPREVVQLVTRFVRHLSCDIPWIDIQQLLVLIDQVICSLVFLHISLNPNTQINMFISCIFSIKGSVIVWHDILALGYDDALVVKGSMHQLMSAHVHHVEQPAPHQTQCKCCCCAVDMLSFCTIKAAGRMVLRVQ